MQETTIPFRLKVILASLANLLAISYIHYLTGYEFLFFVFYFLPVSLSGWYLGRLSVFCFAVLTGMSWCFVDILSNHQYPHEMIRYANSVICFLAFAIIGILVQGLRQALNEQKQISQQLQKAHDELQRWSQELQTLQSHMQVVCAWTKRINVEGKWVPLDEFFRDKLKAQISFGVSPEAMQQILQDATAAQGQFIESP
jgi:K+-sensing histidine kinase KdpD